MEMNLSDSYPILSIEDSLVFANNGNLLLGFRLQLPEIYTPSEKDYEQLHSLWFQALKTLPPGIFVHKQDHYQKASYDASELPATTFLQKATRDHFHGRTFLIHHSLLFFIWPGNKALNTSRYCNPFAQVRTNIVPELDEKARAFITAVDDSVRFLNQSGSLMAEALGQVELLRYTDDFFNGFNEGFDTDILLGKDGTQIGDYHFDVLAINNEGCFGEGVQSSRRDERFSTEGHVFHQGFIDSFGFSLNEDHMFNQILCVEDTHRWRKKLEYQLEELSKSSGFGLQNRVKHEKVSHVLDSINQDETARLVRGQLNVVFWSAQKEALPGIASEIKSRFRELDIRPYAPRGQARVHYLLNSYPCFVSNFSDQDLYVSDLKHALCLLLNTTAYKSDLNGILFCDRQFNLPVRKDVWDEQKKRIKARNFAIFAPTGEGKSFLANNILRQYFEAGTRLVIIDLGGSYAKFAKLYPDDHLILRYEPGRNLGINPFYIKHLSDLTADRLEDLTVFLLELLSASSTYSKAQRVALKRLLKHYYLNCRDVRHSLQGFYDFVKSLGSRLQSKLHIDAAFFDVAHFLHILSEYVEDGLYQFLFEAGEDQSYRLEDKRLIVFELDEVRENREVLSVMLKLIKSAIQRTIWQNRTEKGIILFDEFAKQLKFENVLESVEYYYQAIRKQNGAIGIILQSINQLPEISTSASILENTQVIYSLRNEKGYEALQKRLNLSEHDLNQLYSMRNDLKGDRRYTEIFIKLGSDGNVYRLEVPPEVYAAYLTDGVEHEAIMKLYEKHQSMEKAIIEFVKNQRSQNSI